MDEHDGQCRQADDETKGPPDFFHRPLRSAGGARRRPGPKATACSRH